MPEVLLTEILQFIFGTFLEYIGYLPISGPRAVIPLKTSVRYCRPALAGPANPNSKQVQFLWNAARGRVAARRRFSEKLQPGRFLMRSTLKTGMLALTL